MEQHPAMRIMQSCQSSIVQVWWRHAPCAKRRCIHPGCQAAPSEGLHAMQGTFVVIELQRSIWKICSCQGLQDTTVASPSAAP